MLNDIGDFLTRQLCLAYEGHRSRRISSQCLDVLLLWTPFQFSTDIAYSKSFAWTEFTAYKYYRWYLQVGKLIQRTVRMLSFGQNQHNLLKSKFHPKLHQPSNMDHAHRRKLTLMTSQIPNKWWNVNFKFLIVNTCSESIWISWTVQVCMPKGHPLPLPVLDVKRQK